MNLPDGTSRQDEIERIVNEFKEAVRKGVSLSINEILAQHAELGEELRAQLQATTADSPTVPPTPISSGEEATVGMPSYSRGSTGERATVGDRVGDYRLLRELGRGGMGVVYEAEHTSSDRHLAVKLLSPELPHTDQTISRFLNEASLAAGLSHPRTTFVYEAGERDGHFFISMELMPGKTLKDVVKAEGALPVSRAVDYTLDVLAGLDAAHKSGVVHRDVKPSNCFLDDEGRIKVGDFGLSKSLVSTSDLTLSGTFLGTPQFAAPEQFGRGTVDPRTDLFATAATLYYLIAGHPPFQGDPAAVIAQIVADDPPPLSSLRSDVPNSLSRVVAKALCKDPRKRYNSASDFRDALLPYATGGTSTADLGRRVAAFFLDTIIVSIVFGLLTVIYLVLRFGLQGMNFIGDHAWISGLGFLLYFIVTEGLFSRSLGKKWLGLRVADQDGEAPGIPRSVVRALIVPGLSWLTVDIVQSTYSPQWQPTAGTRLDYSVILLPQLFALLRGVLCLVICSTMRRRNGYRGLHELASGTKVVRPQVVETMTDLPSVPNFAAVRVEEALDSVGGFRIDGTLAARGSLRTLAARDQQLERPVWIYLDKTAIPVSRARRHLARTTRQRWLAEGTNGDEHWQVFEAISGAPLPDVGMYTTIPWSIARHIWLQAAEELQAASEDGTIPDPLTVDQVWVDAHGRLRLSDRRLLEPTEANPDTSDASNGLNAPSQLDVDRQQPMRLLAELAELCTRDEETPAEALDLRNELASAGSTLCPKSVVERLRQFVERPYRLRWDDRLGALAIAAGLEAGLLSPLPLAIASVLTHFHLSKLWAVSLAATGGLLVAASLGYALRGGPAFWLTGIEIRSHNGPATPRRCAWRNVVAWLPLMLLYSAIGVTAGTMIRSGGAPESNIELAILAVCQATFGGLALLGVAYSVLQPRRGLQDLASRTFLVRRVNS